MYQKLLAPLDGSELAECTLQHLRALASGCNIPEVVVFRVVEPLPATTITALAEAGGNLLTEMEESQKNEAAGYVKRIASRLQSEGINATPVVIPGFAAEEILNYAQKNGVDLIIMSTHGRSGIRRWVMGSVTNRVLEHSTVPVMTIIPKGCRVATA